VSDRLIIEERLAAVSPSLARDRGLLTAGWADCDLGFPWIEVEETVEEEEEELVEEGGHGFFLLSFFLIASKRKSGGNLWTCMA